MELNIIKSGSSGPEIVILHGLLGSSRNWQRIMRELSADCRVIVPDLRNHGVSPHGSHSIAAMRDDIVRLIETNCDEPPHLVGHSMGGLAAMAVSTSDTAAIASLTVVDIAPVRRTEGLRKILDALMELDLKSINTRADADRALSEKIYNPDVRQFLLQNLRRNTAGEFEWRCNLPELQRFVAEETFELPPRAVYEGPTLVITGGRSEYKVWEHEKLLRAHFPAMILDIFEDAAHWVHMDAPDRFVKRLREWLDAHASKA
ncbi:MAG: alpha/beta fold hydrolase [Candidatus Dadabacteria bacterium]|nr:alpha/beta fold hydrolase [Candidatus Dadabacteria bacterium]